MTAVQTCSPHRWDGWDFTMLPCSNHNPKPTWDGINCTQKHDFVWFVWTHFWPISSVHVSLFGASFYGLRWLGSEKVCDLVFKSQHLRITRLHDVSRISCQFPPSQRIVMLQNHNRIKNISWFRNPGYITCLQWNNCNNLHEHSNTFCRNLIARRGFDFGCHQRRPCLFQALEGLFELCISELLCNWFLSRWCLYNAGSQSQMLTCAFFRSYDILEVRSSFLHQLLFFWMGSITAKHISIYCYMQNKIPKMAVQKNLRRPVLGAFLFLHTVAQDCCHLNIFWPWPCLKGSVESSLKKTM